MNQRAITTKALNQLEFQTGLVAHVSGYAPAAASCEQGDALIRFENCNAKLVTESHESAERITVDKLSTTLASGYKKLLICDYVSDDQGARLREAKINYLDNVGNAYLDISPIFVLIQGKKPKDDFALNRAAKLFTETGLKVILALLANQGLLNGSYRKIADHANVSMGTIGWVLRELKHQGFTVAKNGQTEWLNRARLIKKWVEEYPTLKAKYLYGTYYVKDQYWWRSLELEKYQAVLGGEIAAVDYSSGLEPTSGEIFVGKHKHDSLIRDLGFVEMDQAQGEFRTRVDVLDKFWGQTEGMNLFDNLAHPLISYASLMDTWDPKSRDLAGKIAERFL